MALPITKLALCGLFYGLDSHLQRIGKNLSHDDCFFYKAA